MLARHVRPVGDVVREGDEGRHTVRVRRDPVDDAAVGRHQVDAVAEPLVPGEEYDFTFRLYPNDYEFSTGSRIGVILVGSYPSFSVPLSTRPALTVDLKQTRIVLPVEGGHRAAMDSGGF